MKHLFYINCILFVIIVLCILHSFSKCSFFESYEQDSFSEFDNNNKQRPPGPWGDIGTRHSWQDYPYVLNWINY